MKISQYNSLWAVLVVCLLLTACGGGGGSGGNSSGNDSNDAGDSTAQAGNWGALEWDKDKWQ